MEEYLLTTWKLRFNVNKNLSIDYLGHPVMISDTNNNLPNSDALLSASACLAIPGGRGGAEEDAADETVSSESTLFIHLFLRLPSGDAESTSEGVDLAACSGLV